MSTDLLQQILEEINVPGKFRANLFVTTEGLVLASARNPSINEKIVAAMGSLLADAAEKAKQEINLSDIVSVQILYNDGLLLCRQIPVKKTFFLLAVLADVPAGNEFEKYNNDLLKWAVVNSTKLLEDLAAL
ncbi:MAG: hypothetical protein RBG13Loki_0041 [Promethearchaeota archaeon CR_4]|nr:MAG: hypothetical protein RBG13Loki_0041 [Candidatus Lokiarchaeota archaeon CR_4]